MDIISVNTKIPYNIIIKPNILDRLGELVKKILVPKGFALYQIQMFLTCMLKRLNLLL